MNRLTSSALRYPRATIALGALVVLAAAPGVLRLTLRTDGHALVPEDEPEVQYDLRMREQFDLKDPLVIYIESRRVEGIFNVQTLTLVEQLTQELQRLDGVSPHDVFSLATEKNDRVWPGTLRFRGFLDPVPQTQEELAQLRNDLRQLQLYKGTLISADETSTAIMVGVPAGADRLEFLDRIRALVASHDGQERIVIIGAPVAEALLGTHILEDLGIPKSVLGISTYDERDVPTPRSLDDVRIWIARTIGLVPLAIALMGLVFLISFRSVIAAMLPLLEVAACLLFVFGVMGWLGVPIYLTTAVLPIILTATGVTDEVHVFFRFRHLLQCDALLGGAAAARATMVDMSRPIVMTSLTTGVGFLSFVTSSIAPVRAFGIFAALGMVFCMVWTLTVVPASLSLISPRRFVRPSAEACGPTFLSRAFGAMGSAVIRLRFVILAGAALAVALAPRGIGKVFVQDSWIDGFAPSSEFHQSTQSFNAQFLGMHVLHVVVQAGGESLHGEIAADAVADTTVRLSARLFTKGELPAKWRLRLRRIGASLSPTANRFRPIQESEWWIEAAEPDGDQVVLTLQKGRPSPRHFLGLGPDSRIEFELSPARLMEPDILKRVQELEWFIEQRRDDAVGGVLGPGEYVATTNFMILARKANSRRIPMERPQLERVWREYGNVRGKDRLRQLVDSAYGRAVVTVLLRDANFVGTARLMDAIREYEKAKLAPSGISLSFAGDVAVSQTLIEAIVRTQVQSVLGSLLGILIVTVILGRSLWFGILCVIPCSIAVLTNFAAMGWLGIPLGVATSMFASMALGIGVDYAIHLQSHFRRLLAGGQQRRAALIEAIATTGPAIFIDTVAVAGGFGILTLSQVPANARLGGLVALSIGVCFVATILLLPALLNIGREHPTKRATSSHLQSHGSAGALGWTLFTRGRSVRVRE